MYSQGCGGSSPFDGTKSFRSVRNPARGAGFFAFGVTRGNQDSGSNRVESRRRAFLSPRRGLIPSSAPTHGLRRRLYSFAASRLESLGEKIPISRAKNAREMGHPSGRFCALQFHHFVNFALGVGRASLCACRRHRRRRFGLRLRRPGQGLLFHSRGNLHRQRCRFSRQSLAWRGRKCARGR